MTLKEQLYQLTQEKGNPCITISVNTHRTHPDNMKDILQLKNKVKEAEERIMAEFDRKQVETVLQKLRSVSDKIDVYHNLDSLHIFLSENAEVIVRSPWKIPKDMVHISDSFAVRPLIQMYNRSERYLVLLLSQGGVQMYEALNDSITGEIKKEGFPFSENRHYITDAERRSDSKQVDNMIREFFNKVDKAVVKVSQETGLPCIVISTENNYSYLREVADVPAVYIGHAPVDYNNTAIHDIAKQAWEVIRNIQHERRAKAVKEMKEAVSQGNVLTDLQEIFQASVEGKGDLLIVHNDFSQPVKMTGERSFDIVNDVSAPEVIDDISSNIAWEVLSKKGRVVFTTQDEIKELGDIVLKTRY